MVDSGATNSFVHSQVAQWLNAATVDIPAIRATLADSSFIDYSTAVPLYLKLCGNLQLCSSRVSKMVQIGCHVLCSVFPNLTSDVVLGMDQLYVINPWIDWHAYSLFIDCRDQIVRILGTEQSCFRGNIEVFALSVENDAQ